MPLSGKDLVKILEQSGWETRRISGSHHILVKGNETVVVPVHGNKSLGKGLERKILKQTGLKKMTLAYFAKITKQDDAHFLVEFPELPGCLTEGKSLRQALENAQEALNGYLASLCDRNLNIKSPKIHKGRNYHSIDVDLRLAFAIGLRQARKKHGYTQSAVAHKLGISQQAYAKLEAPDANPSLDTIQKISEALGSKIQIKLVS